MKNIPTSIRQYLMRHVRDGRREFIVESCDGIDQVVVIPVLAEKETLFETLQTLSANEPTELSRTLVICVINNLEEGLADSHDIDNNRQTLALLRSMIHGNLGGANPPDATMAQQIRCIQSSGLRLACLDASSRGMEMPKKDGGVGLARKLGLDRALSLFDYCSPFRKLLYNLDADTWVEPCYLSAVRRFFEDQKAHAAVVGFSHCSEADPVLSAAICCYEIFLRYYVLGLRFAGSPYAFHTIGSTMVCTPESYAAVHGMNRRKAAEDFYFLNKLAKIGPVAAIGTTTVSASARPSRRVPFGTGQRMIRFLEGRQNEYLLYDPDVFLTLKGWLDIMTGSGRQEAQAVLNAAECIHPLLRSFLELNRFQEVWPRIRKNHREADARVKQFHVWFDGFKTLKLIHYLTEKGFPKRDMFFALKVIMDRMNISCPVAIHEKTQENLAEQKQILNVFRMMQ